MGNLAYGKTEQVSFYADVRHKEKNAGKTDAQGQDIDKKRMGRFI